MTSLLVQPPLCEAAGVSDDDQGFRLYKSRADHLDLGSVHEARAWTSVVTTTGLSLGDVQQWREAGFSPEEVRTRLEAGLDNRCEAAACHRSMFSVEEAAQWRTRGIPLASALLLRDMGVSQEEAARRGT